MEPPVLERLLGLLAEREAEQSQVARMLHDDAGQVLSAIGLHLDVLRGDLGPEHSNQVVEIQQLLEHAIGSIRAASQALHINVVERAGLAFALEQLAAKGREQSGEVTVRLLVTPGERWPNGPAHAAYRIVEAVLSNALRHAKAQRIEVRMQGGVIEVRDDGRGFDPTSPTEGLGLLVCRYLARRASVGMTIQSSAGQGTIVKLTLNGL